MNQDEFEKAEEKLILDYASKADPVLLHKMAMECNWDSASSFLNWLINNPTTDKATALMLYWMSGPRYWKQYKDTEDVMAKRKCSTVPTGFEFTEKLEKKYIEGFFKNQTIAYDPNVKDHSGTLWTKEYSTIETVRDIPQIMFQKLEGTAVEAPEGYMEGIPPDLYLEWEKLYEEYTN